MIILFIIILIICICLWLKNLFVYNNSNYYKITQLPYLKIRFNKGLFGEYLTYLNLKKLETEGAKFLFNVYIPKEEGGTNEIDILMISQKGIFVIESKNFSGWIFGDETREKWCQCIKDDKGDKYKNYFFNPIIQNRTHIKHLKKLLENFNTSFHSIVVFSERCTLKKINLKNNDNYVIKRNQIEIAVSNISKKATTLLSEHETNAIFDLLYPFTQVCAIDKEEHIFNIQHNKMINNTKTDKKYVIQDSNQNNTELLCPKCNSPLKLRTAKKGQHSGKSFLGCSKFPKCRYIEKIDES